jgi:hypothetical protein
MKKLSLTMLIGALFASTVSSLPVFNPPPNQVANCQLLVCGCKPKPGEVDPCSRNFDFRNTNTGPIRFENQAPMACGQSVEDNLSSLSKYYGSRPEIGLPTQEMVNIVDSLVVPVAGPLIDSRLLEASEATDVSKPLDKRIRIAIQRISALIGDARAFADITMRNNVWKSATVSADRLTKRAEGASKMLSLERSWPSINEFAPKVWGLLVCERVQPTTVKQLGQRLLDDKDDAWNFALYEDWVEFLEPFRALQQLPVDARSQAIARPFFTESLDRVQVRSVETLQTSVDVRKFKESVEKKSASLTPYVSDRQARASIRRDELSVTFNREKTVISELREAVKLQQDTVLPIKDRINSTTALKAKTVGDVATLRMLISNGASALVSRIAKRDQLRIDSKAAESKTKIKRDEVTSAQRTLDAVVLNCGGKPYELCNDDAAKRVYDQLSYKANLALSLARTSYTKTVVESMLLNDQLLATEDAIPTLRAVLVQQKQDLGVLLKSKDEIDALLGSLIKQLQNKENEVLPLTRALIELDLAVTSLDLLRPR